MFFNFRQLEKDELFKKKAGRKEFEEKIITDLYELSGFTELTQNGFHNRGTDPALGHKGCMIK
jgi:hypothetical protein